MLATIGALIVLALCFFHYKNNVTPGSPDPNGMDMIQVARNVANNNGFSTNIVRPLWLGQANIKANKDGSLPDVAHAPLYPILAGIAIKIAGTGRADTAAVGLSLLFFLTSLGACYLLAVRLFGPSGALLSCLLYGLSASMLRAAVTPGPMTLATTLFTLLLLVLFGIDGASANRRAAIGKAALAGGLYGLLYLSLYSSLLLLAPLVVYLYVITRRDPRVAGIFLLAAAVMAFPALLRNQIVAGNPFFNARLLELVMNTETYPGYGQYRAVLVPQTLFQYLTDGGFVEILRKVGSNLLGYYGGTPYTFGVLLFPLFLVAALTRFTSPQVNRLRLLVYVLIGVHLLGLSFYLPYLDGLPIFVMYLPFVAVIGTTFFIYSIRARNLPLFYERAAITSWIVIACIPGVVQLFGGTKPESTGYSVHNLIATDPQLTAALSSREGVIASESPWDVAYRNGYPAIWLPNDSTEFRATEERMGKSVVAIVLTPSIFLYNADPETASWRSLYLMVPQLVQSQTWMRMLSPAERQEMQQRMPRIPLDVVDTLSRFALTPPIPERGGAASIVLIDKVLTEVAQK